MHLNSKTYTQPVSLPLDIHPTSHSLEAYLYLHIILTIIAQLAVLFCELFMRDHCMDTHGTMTSSFAANGQCRVLYITLSSLIDVRFMQSGMAGSEAVDHQNKIRK